MKKGLSCLLALILILSMALSASAETVNFTDVKSTDYFYDSVQWAYAQGITKGTTDTTFFPGDPCIRKQVVMFLWRAKGCPEPASMENPFTDVAVGSYYEKPILWAYYAGITTGKTDTTFQPDAPCTRAQIVTFLWRCEGKPTPGSTDNPFTDVAAGSFFETPILWAYCAGITTGKTATAFQPGVTCTRAQIVTFLYRDLVEGQEKEEVPSVDTDHTHDWGSWIHVITPNEEDSYYYRTCTQCGAMDTTKEVHYHYYGQWIHVDATCTEDAYYYRTCECGDTQTDPVTGSAREHLFSILSGEKDGVFLYSCANCGEIAQSTEETRFDKDIPVPEIAAVHDRRIVCSPVSLGHENNSLQAVFAKDADFTQEFSLASAPVAGSPDYIGLSSSVTGTYYYKLRFCWWDGDTCVYGPWSETAVLQTLNFETELDSSPQYTYELYYIDHLGTDLYSDSKKAIYIKTNNPDPASIRLMVNGEQACSSPLSYADVTYLDPTDKYCYLRKVEGGYITNLHVLMESEVDSDPGIYNVSGLAEAGPVTVELWEANAEGYVVAETFQQNVLDLQEEYRKWYASVIESQTDDTMNPKEKMDAICAYLTNGQFRYFVTNGTHYLTLAADPNYPELQSKRWNSFISPNRLAGFAALIGGFEEIHNCYGDYPAYSEEWYATHYYIYVVYEGETYYYKACPPTSTGLVETIPMIDFTNTAQFTPIN